MGYSQYRLHMETGHHCKSLSWNRINSQSLINLRTFQLLLFPKQCVQWWRAQVEKEEHSCFCSYHHKNCLYGSDYRYPVSAVWMYCSSAACSAAVPAGPWLLNSFRNIFWFGPLLNLLYARIQVLNVWLFELLARKRGTWHFQIGSRCRQKSRYAAKKFSCIICRIEENNC